MNCAVRVTNKTPLEILHSINNCPVVTKGYITPWLFHPSFALQTSVILPVSPVISILIQNKLVMGTKPTES